MIKINLDSKPKGKTKYMLCGCVEVGGDIGTLSYEMYTIIKSFEKKAPEAFVMAMEKLIYDTAELEEE